MVDRIRTEFQRIRTGEGGGQRMSQAELDAYRRQLVMLAITVTAVLLIVILAAGAFYQYVYLPRQSVAAVGGDEISRSDYWDYRRYELLMQINQYQQMSQFVEGEQAQQYQQLAVEARQEFDDVEDASVNPVTVDQMIENRIITDAMDDFGIEISDQEIEDFMVQYFTGTPVGDDSSEPAVDPTAEAWATSTAEAQQEEMEATAEAGADAESEESATEEDSADATADSDSEENTEDADSNNTDGDDSDEPANEDSEDEEAEPSPTPAEEDVRATAESIEREHEEFVLDEAGLSRDEFIDMYIIPEIARERIQEELGSEVPTRAEQVEAAHILVATEEAANQVYEDLTADDASDFAEVAEEQSTDQQTAPNGGELGWFPQGVMVPEFDEVVFDLEVDEISEPFQTEFGWHIATVLDREDDRPVETQVLQQLRQQAFDEWLAEQRESTEIDTGDLQMPEDSGMPGPGGQFQPPAGAPQPPPQQPQPQPDGSGAPDMEGPVEDEGSSDSEGVFEEGEDPFDNAGSDDEED